jgi:hypothetical protein
MDVMTKPPPEAADPLPKHGQGLRALVEARRRELELALNEVKQGGTEKSADIEAALDALKALLTGDLNRIPPVVARDLSQWIETSKYLGTIEPATKSSHVSSGTVPQDFRAFVDARRQQHELELSEIKKRAPAKAAAVETALRALKALLAGDLDQIPPNVAQELGQYIETSKYLGSKSRGTGQE